MAKLNTVFFSDEAWVHLDGYDNAQNSCLCGNRPTLTTNWDMVRCIARASCCTFPLYGNYNCGVLSMHHGIVYCIFRARGTLLLVIARWRPWLTPLVRQYNF